ncbi:MAG: DUF3048 domain-containing protein [Lachnospiraceae bacterium]|nr:DUF3048 domain-containing protein [Lachnospiraceae bacterium]MDE6185257.1 DUF3048 domain-containing protein [Lachnospiraceae bacterium]MDE7286187.1 DUF3048 domain-containing protein [Lachnospiraceae bacterium]
MKRLQVLFLVALSSSLLLFGCGKSEEASTPIVEPIIEAQPGAPEENETQAQDSADSETPPAEGMVRSRLTNEWVDENIAKTRPIAVMIPNSKTASQYDISKASVLYECNVEGSMTRLMGVFEDWSNVQKLGNIRSCRDYYVYWAFEWDAIYIHYGGPFYIDDIIGRSDTQNINCIEYGNATFRDSAKNSTDNAFTSTDRIKDAASHYGYPLEYRDGYADEQHYMFASDKEPNTLDQYSDAITASKVDMSPAYPVTNCYFVYNESTGLYDRYQHLSGDSDGPHIDLANNQQLSFKNLLIQNTYFEVRDQKGYLAFQCHDTTRDGWFFTNGKGIHVTWEKTSDYGATRYYDDAGNEIKLNTGKTMVCILEDGDTFTVDGKTIEAD